MSLIISNKLNKICLAALLGLIVLVPSCKKESYTLNGTTWAGTYSDSKEVFMFQQNTFLWMEEIANGTLTTYTGTYTYDHPDVYLQSTTNNFPFSWQGGVKGNTMSLVFQTGLDTSKIGVVILTKQ